VVKLQVLLQGCCPGVQVPECDDEEGSRGIAPRIVNEMEISL
jgi:hypothetical protein